MKNNKILITGGFGFIGNNITRRLISNGFEIIVLENGSIVYFESAKKVRKDSSKLYSLIGV